MLFILYNLILKGFFLIFWICFVFIYVFDEGFNIMDFLLLGFLLDFVGVEWLCFVFIN